MVFSKVAHCPTQAAKHNIQYLFFIHEFDEHVVLLWRSNGLLNVKIMVYQIVLHLKCRPTAILRDLEAISEATSSGNSLNLLALLALSYLLIDQ